MAGISRLSSPAAPRALPARLRCRDLGEHAVAALLSLFALLMLMRVGPTLTVFLVLVGALVLLAISDTRIYAFAVLLLAPLPAVGALIGYEFPLGVEPLNLLVIIGVLVVLVTSTRFVRPSPVLLGLITVNLLLLTISWMRTYGDDGVGPQDLVLTIKPALYVLGGFLLVSVIPRERLIPTLALAMFGTLLIVELSVLLQRAGLYQTSFQTANIAALQFKQYGGIMLQGNVAASFVATFTIPTYLLLRASGRPQLAILTLLIAFPVILVTLSRTAMIAFLFALLVFMIFSERSLRGAATVIAAVLVSVWFALTLGQEQTSFIVENLQRYGSNTNAHLSGRESIWEAVFTFLREEPERLFVGGGLDSFRDEVTRALGAPYSTHNAFLYALANGGILMLVATVAFWVYCLQRWRDLPPEVATAVRIAALVILVVSLSTDTTPYSPAVAWMWVLLAAAHRLSRTEEGPAQEAPSPASAPLAAR